MKDKLPGDYPALNSVETCAACGFFQSHDNEEEYIWPVFGMKYVGTKKNKRIIRTCPRCGYQWNERALNG